MTRINWDAENRRAKMRKWYANNHAELADLEKPPEVSDQWDLWARREVRRSVQRVKEAARERALHAESSEGQILALLEAAAKQIAQGDEIAVRGSLTSALEIVQQCRTGSLEKRTKQTVFDSVGLMWALTESVDCS
ncbi:hypothetical protein OAD85_08340 [Actinomycetota bacterium]|nr:hypothetical protein [Actinomycetota bacterium]